MVHFVGAGPGAPDLITQRGAAFLQASDCIIYAGSLVNPALLGLAKPGCAIYNSAEMTLEQVLDVMRRMEAAGKNTVRLHTGDPCLYGAIREQMDALDADGICYDDTPGVSSFCGAAAALNAEYTLPTVSQTVIITRMEGRTPVPERERLASLAAHGATMVIFLSIGLIDKVQTALLQGAYTPDTPAAVVYKASWPEEKIVRCTVGSLAESTRAGWCFSCRMDKRTVCAVGCADICRRCGHCGAGHRAPLQEQDYRPSCGSGGRMRAVCRTHSVRTSRRRERSGAGHCHRMRSRAGDHHRHRCPRHFCGGRVGKAPKLHGTGAGTHQAGQQQITGRTAGLLLG